MLLLFLLQLEVVVILIIILVLISNYIVINLLLLVRLLIIRHGSCSVVVSICVIGNLKIRLGDIVAVRNGVERVAGRGQLGLVGVELADVGEFHSVFCLSW